MAKRFSDTNKWDKSWFVELPIQAKLLWFYMLDKCSIAGVFDVSYKTLSFILEQPIDKDFINTHIGKQIEWLSESKILIKDFITFQYGHLNPNCLPHQAVIKELDKINPTLSLPFANSYPRVKYKDKEKDKNKDKEKEKEILRLTQLLYDCIIKNLNHTKFKNNPPELDKWYNDIELLHRIDGVSYKQIEQVIFFATSNSFWKTNILSGKKLREKFTTLEAQMKQPKNQRTQPTLDEVQEYIRQTGGENE